MNGKINTPRTVCKAIVAVAIAAVAVAAIIGCESTGGGTRKQNIATVIQTAYDFGGREMHPQRSCQVPRRATRGALRSKVARYHNVESWKSSFQNRSLCEPVRVRDKTNLSSKIR